MIPSDETPLRGLRALRTPLDFVIILTAVFGIYEVLRAINLGPALSLLVAVGCIALLIGADYYLARRGAAPYFRLFGFTRIPKNAMVIGSTIEVDVTPPPAQPEFKVQRDYVFVSPPRIDDCFDTLEDSTVTPGRSIPYSSPDSHVVRQVRSSPGRLIVYWTPNKAVPPLTLFSHVYSSNLLSRLDGEGNFYIISHAYPAGSSKLRIRTWRPIREAACYTTREAFFSDEEVFRGALLGSGLVAPDGFSFTSNEITLSLGFTSAGTRVYIAWTHGIDFRSYWRRCAMEFCQQRIRPFSLRARLERRRIRRFLSGGEPGVSAIGNSPNN